MLAIIEIKDIMPFLAFGAMFAGIWVLLTALSSRNTKAEERLSKLGRTPSMMDLDLNSGRGSTGSVDRKMQSIIDKAMAFAKPMMPKTEIEQSKLRQELAMAGFRSEKAPKVFMGIRTICLVIASLFLITIVLPMNTPDGDPFNIVAAIQNAPVTILLTLLLGLFGPSFVLMYLRRKRQESIFLTLPDVLDLMVVCVESGLGLDAAMRKVCEEMRDHAPIITEEFNIANFQLQMGRTRRDVLHDLGVRTGVDDMKSLAAILVQADRFGSSVGQALRVQSDSMRIRRRQIAEEKAAKTAVKLIFPLVLFIFPGIFVVLAGPAAIQVQKNL
ncbi:MAG TPA: type II secretion system F family protein [Gemmatales bacterium]|nr:type II secretion system F family protein [Gemmatales bacterium]